MSKQVVKWVTVHPGEQAGNKTKSYFIVDSARNKGFCGCLQGQKECSEEVVQ